METLATKKKSPVTSRARSSQAVPKIAPTINHQRPKIREILNTTSIQPKLTIGAPNDKYEQEADQVADQVMRMPDPQGTSASDGVQPKNNALPTIQRMCPECEEELKRQPLEEEDEELLQTKSLIQPLIQRQTDLEEDEEGDLLQAKATPGHTPQVTPTVAANIQSLKGGGQPLPKSTRSFFEPRFGQDLSQVRLHTDSKAANTAQAVNAKAFTLSRDIVFGAGQYQPHTPGGKRLIAHELVHVRQQHQESTVALSPLPEIMLQLAPKTSKHQSLPAAAVTATTATIFDKPNIKATKQHTLKQNDPVKEVIEKRKVNDTWWYKIRYKAGKGEKTGWALAENFSEIASPEKFKFTTPGSSGIGSPFEALREAVAKEKLESKIARLINLMNILILPKPGLTLPDFVYNSFYDALIKAKGNFKKASLLVTAAVRAFKPTKSGDFSWVQAKVTKTSKFDPATFRDKLWHFFWNAYEKFDGTSSGWLDFKGVMYELKSRSNPVSKIIELEPFNQDAKEDIIYNRAGVKFAEWVMRNQKTVIRYHYSEIEKRFRAAAASDTEMSKLSESEINKMVASLMQSTEAEIELQKRCYTDFADYAARYVELAIDAVKKISIGKIQTKTGNETHTRSILFFEFNSTDFLRGDIMIDSKARLAGALEQARQHFATYGNSSYFTVHGYASEEGKKLYNVDLSRRRAEAIKALLKMSGIPEKNIGLQSHGEDKTYSGLAYNRRVEIEYTFYASP